MFHIEMRRKPKKRGGKVKRTKNRPEEQENKKRSRTDLTHVSLPDVHSHFFLLEAQVEQLLRVHSLLQQMK